MTIASFPELAAPTVLARDERRRITLRVGAGLAGTALLALGTVLIHAVPEQWQIGELVRAVAAAVVGAPLLWSGARGLLTGDPRRASDQLIALAVLAAMSAGQFVTATLIPLFVEIGRIFEDRSSLGARAAIEGVRALGARHATLWRDGIEERVEPSALIVGDEILVRPGERVAVDGVVIAGQSAVDQAPVTGESQPEDVGPGSAVFAGTINVSGLLRVRVRGAGADTLLGRIVGLLAQLESARLPAVRLIERRAGAWLPLVLTISATTLFFTHDLARAITVLVVACPTALIIAGPAAVVAAMTAASRRRILIKSADFLERSSEVDTLVFDKTGTVTIGAPSVTSVEPLDQHGDEALLRAAACCAFGSLHPVSRAVLAEARRRRIDVERPDSVEERPGLGVVARTGDRILGLGRGSLLRDLGAQFEIEEAGEGGEVWACEGGRVLGCIRFADTARAEARAALDDVRALGITRLVLLTGDRAGVAERIGEMLGADEVIAQVLPTQKLEVVRAEQAAGHTVMMVGDGVNDALALSAADVGVAIGAEINEVALGGADVALLGADLGRLPALIRLGDRVRHTVNQNIALGLFFAVGLMGFAVAGVLTPLSGALAQNLAAVAVVLNSGRLLGGAPGSGAASESKVVSDAGA